MKIIAGAMQAGLLQAFLLVLLSTVTWAGPLAAPYPAFDSHVTDAAAVMGAHAAAIDRKLKAFEAVTGHQVFVLTVASTGSRSIDEYAVDVFQKWKVGRKPSDDGVLFVIAVADRKIRIEVGYGLEGVLTDAQCSRIIREIAMPSLAQGRYAEGVAAAVDAVLATLGVQAPAVSAAASAAATEAPAQRREHHGGRIVLRVIFSVLFLAIVIGSVWFGGLLLPVLLVPVLVIPASLWPQMPSTLMSTAIFAAWFYARYRLIADNVRRYHLPPGGSRLTWLWMFFAEQGSTRPLREGEKPGFRMKVSFSLGKSSDNDRGSSDSGGAGGRSGGAGASGSW